MKRMKKFLAMFLAMAMVLGMSMTTFAMQDTTHVSNITVKGLATGVDDKGQAIQTTVALYNMVYLDVTTEGGVTKNEWKIQSWAQNFVQLSEDEKTYELVNVEGLLDALPQDAYSTKQVTIDTAEFTDVPVGAYAIKATDPSSKVTYSAMVANTFDTTVTNGTMAVAKNVTVYAKSDDYQVTKTADKSVAGVGEVVEFTVTTTFPSFEEDVAGHTYKIVDTPTGLAIANKADVTIGDNEFNDVTVTKENDNYVIDLSSYIGTGDTFNANAGKTVTVTYSAVVTSPDGFGNTANAMKDNTNIGTADKTDPDPENPDDPDPGFEGKITVEKIDGTDNTVTLKGAEFQVTKKESATTYSSPIAFVEVSEGLYRVAITSEKASELAEQGITVNADDADDIVTTIAATEGTVIVKGLGEGTYHFVETKAPDGYALDANEDRTMMADVTIAKADAKDTNNTEGQLIKYEDQYKNTTLSALPSTGGIGTTIFTVGGCAIMIIAAGLYFASRRKAAK